MTIHRLIILLLAIASSPAMAKINVFACEPEWGSLAQEIGGNDVKIYTATTAFQDPHRIEARPSLIAKMRRSDIVVCSGADLEVGWLPLLIRSSSNKKVMRGQPGYFEAALQVERLGIPANVDRSMGDVHVQGNPHVHLDPARLLTIAKKLGERLAQIDNSKAANYEKRTQDFVTRWKQAMQTWQQKAATLKGKRAVVHHKDWAYMLDWLGMQEAAAIEPKPGVSPSSGHLAKLVTELKSNPPSMIIYTSYQDGKPAKWLSERTNIPVIQLPFTVGGSDKATDLFKLIDETLDLLLKAAR